MANSIIKTNGGLVPNSRATIELANATIMQKVSGDADVYQLNDTYFIVFVSLGIKYTASRVADMGAWRIKVDGTTLTPMHPHFILSWVDGNTTIYQSFADTDNGWFKNPVALSANQIARWTGTVLYRK